MSRTGAVPALGLSEDEAAALGPDSATRIRTFRLVLVLGQKLRTLMDQLLREDGLTTQQAALITVAEAGNGPPLSQIAAALGTTHQNVKQIAVALERKGFVRVVQDEHDARVRRVVTTPRSRRYWAQRSPSDQERVLEWFTDLSADEAQTLFELLVRLANRVDAILAQKKRPAAGPTRGRAPVQEPRARRM